MRFRPPLPPNTRTKTHTHTQNKKKNTHTHIFPPWLGPLGAECACQVRGWITVLISWEWAQLLNAHCKEGSGDRCRSYVASRQSQEQQEVSAHSHALSPRERLASMSSFSAEDCLVPSFTATSKSASAESYRNWVAGLYREYILTTL